jgi:hypothetical protein
MRFYSPEDFPGCWESSEWLERGSSTGIYLGLMEFSKL